MSSSKEKFSKYIKDAALDLGFSACGIARAEHLTEEGEHLKSWLQQGHHAGMGYMNRNVDKRLNPALLNEWTQSVIVVLFNYYPEQKLNPEGKYKFSKYAYGKDYHEVMKKKLIRLIDMIEDEIGEITARAFVDSAPVLERAWARKSGLGWIGKNACMINKQSGSFFFIGSIITDLELSYDEPTANDFCGNCTKCIDACPNQAILSPGVIDAGKCISYLSIEHKGDFEAKDKGKLHSWIFGCDICQDVCPWNRFAKPHNEPAFLPSKKFLNMKDEDWESLEESTFDELFKDTAVERTGFTALRRNID
ncbi:MAG: tRNA epoxyqueuosine(34) reductase QueG [Bacteroidota bacterium]